MTVTNENIAIQLDEWVCEVNNLKREVNLLVELVNYIKAHKGEIE